MMHVDEFLKRTTVGKTDVWDQLMRMPRHIAFGACNKFRVDDSIKDGLIQGVASPVFTHWLSLSTQNILSRWICVNAAYRFLDEFRKRNVRDVNQSHRPGENTSVLFPNGTGHDTKCELMQ